MSLEIKTFSSLTGAWQRLHALTTHPHHVALSSDAQRQLLASVSAARRVYSPSHESHDFEYRTHELVTLERTADKILHKPHKLRPHHVEAAVNIIQKTLPEHHDRIHDLAFTLEPAVKKESTYLGRLANAVGHLFSEPTPEQMRQNSFALPDESVHQLSVITNEILRLNAVMATTKSEHEKKHHRREQEQLRHVADNLERGVPLKHIHYGWGKRASHHPLFHPPQDQAADTASRS